MQPSIFFLACTIMFVFACTAQPTTYNQPTTYKTLSFSEEALSKNTLDSILEHNIYWFWGPLVLDSALSEDAVPKYIDLEYIQRSEINLRTLFPAYCVDKWRKDGFVVLGWDAFTYPLDADRAVLFIDSDRDGSFRDEKADTLQSEEEYLMKDFVLRNKNGESLNMPLAIILKNDGPEGFLPFYRNANTYIFRHSDLGDDLSIQFFPTFRHFYFPLKYKGSQRHKERSINYSNGEPFYLNGKWMLIRDIDVVKKELVLETLGANDLPYGRKPGYFVHWEELSLLTEGSKDFIRGDTFHWKEREYYLLHFWGDWCWSCRENLENDMALTRTLKKNDSIQLVHFPTIHGERASERALQFMLEHGVEGDQILQLYGADPLACEKETQRYRSACDVLSLLDITSYPTYILIDGQKKIILNTSKFEEVKHKLLSLGIIQ